MYGWTWCVALTFCRYNLLSLCPQLINNVYVLQVSINQSTRRVWPTCLWPLRLLIYTMMWLFPSQIFPRSLATFGDMFPVVLMWMGQANSALELLFMEEASSLQSPRDSSYHTKWLESPLNSEWNNIAWIPKPTLVMGRTTNSSSHKLRQTIDPRIKSMIQQLSLYFVFHIVWHSDLQPTPSTPLCTHNKLTDEKDTFSSALVSKHVTKFGWCWVFKKMSLLEILENFPFE